MQHWILHATVELYNIYITQPLEASSWLQNTVKKVKRNKVNRRAEMLTDRSIWVFGCLYKCVLLSVKSWCIWSRAANSQHFVPIFVIFKFYLFTFGSHTVICGWCYNQTSHQNALKLQFWEKNNHKQWLYTVFSGWKRNSKNLMRANTEWFKAPKSGHRPLGLPSLPLYICGKQPQLVKIRFFSKGQYSQTEPESIHVQTHKHNMWLLWPAGAAGNSWEIGDGVALRCAP